MMLPNIDVFWLTVIKKSAVYAKYADAHILLTALLFLETTVQFSTEIAQPKLKN